MKKLFAVASVFSLAFSIKVEHDDGVSASGGLQVDGSADLGGSLGGVAQTGVSFGQSGAAKVS